jgi:hypothetical protein
MYSKKPTPEQAQLEAQREAQRILEEERQKLVLHKVRLPNGATFTRLKPAMAG